VGAARDVTACRARQQLALSEYLRQQHALFEAVQNTQEQERRRFAESLHNGLGQLLYATKLRLEQLPLPEAEPVWQEVASLLGEAIEPARKLSHEPAPPLIEEFGLEAALRRICQQLASPALRWQLVVDLTATPTLPASLNLLFIG
jgi:signal transduction histidine kinase